MQRLERLAPVAALNEPVPFRYDIAHWTTAVALTEWNSTVHAARRLSAHGILRNRTIKLAPVPHAVFHRLTPRRRAAKRQKAFRISHDAPLRSPIRAAP